jgi:UDP-N-acetylmuramoylalanine--D-glutamate ligase
MRNTDYFRKKKITIVGFARSGLSCANLLWELGAEVFISDNQDNPDTRANLAKLKSAQVKTELGQHTREFIQGKDLVVISPGVPDTAQPIVWAKELGIPIISEIEVAAILCPAPIIAVTGTNGKTTVTTLIGEILSASNRRVCVCGNIGKPFSGEVSSLSPSDWVSLEVSSFQLEHIRAFQPKISLILNLSINHLDRYNSLQDYLAAKKRIFLNQDKNDFLVLNADDPAIGVLGKEARAKVVYFSQDPGLNPNQCAVLTVADILGIEKGLALEVLRNFKGVEHRLEQVGRVSGVNFINDSKATTVDATIWALKNSSSGVILIAGGREKGNDYCLIKDLLKEKVKAAILIGEAKEKIKQAFAGIIPTEESPSLEEAVNKAFSRAQPGEEVLFSPMCKSFDMFRDYEERGRIFKQAVRALKEGAVSHGA